MMNEDPERVALVQRLIDTWDGDLGELLELAQLVSGIRQRAIAFGRALEREKQRTAIQTELDLFPAGVPYYAGAVTRSALLRLLDRATAPTAEP
jgi:hypothetical protein